MSRRARLALCLWAGFAIAAQADAWLTPGNEGLRADIQLLADAGVLRGPVTTWPLSWPDIARDVLDEGKDRSLSPAVVEALWRVRRLARDASGNGFAGVGYRVSAAANPSTLRQFADSPREEGELAVRASWLSDHLAANLQATYALDPDDGKAWRPDGSYLGATFGNVMLSAGYLERWWGPGWDGSLILSNNARPIPSLTLERNYSTPFETRWLSWLGPWRASVSLGRAESTDVPVPGVRFFAMRLNFKPRPWLELGISRTAQWCGGERQCDVDTFIDMVLGNDNQVEAGEATEEQPGNQMAGYDMRLNSPWRSVPLAFYTQWIGEDEAAGLPSKFLGQFGLETWGGSPIGNWRMRAEYSDTTCNFSRQDPQFGCAYRHPIYPQGYAYRHRIIGHAMDNDSRSYSLGVVLTRPDGDMGSLTVRRVDVNRDGGPHSISDVPLVLDNVELRYSRLWGAGRISAGMGFEDPATGPDSSSRVHGFVNWQQGF